MYRQIVAVAAVLTWLSAGVLSAQTVPTQNVQERFKPVGMWAARPYRVPVSTDLDVAVFGPRAVSVRRAELSIRSSGEGLLRVTRSVLDGKGRTVPGSVSIDEAQMKVTWPAEVETPPPAKWLEYPATVEHAERRYPGTSRERWALDGLIVKLSTLDPSGKTLELRFDPADGQDSFGDTLLRQGAGR